MRKNRANRAKHGVDFAMALDFEWETALVAVDDREDYGELREKALGFIGPILYALVFTERGEDIRVLSLRKATKSELRSYAENI